jgi:hypothetical protein
MGIEVDLGSLEVFWFLFDFGGFVGDLLSVFEEFREVRMILSRLR